MTTKSETASMTGKQRMLTALRHGKPDRVPVAPDISVMIPTRLSGRPFWDIYLGDAEPNILGNGNLADAYVAAVHHFGMDGWYIYGGLREIRDGRVKDWVSTVEDYGTHKVERKWVDTPHGRLTQVFDYPADMPAWPLEKPIKNLREDWPKLRSYLESGGRWESSFRDYDKIGDLGVYAPCVITFVDWWNSFRHGGFTAVFADLADEPAYMQHVWDLYCELEMAHARALIAARPDELFVGGSSSSLSISSPSVFVKYDLPLIQEASRLAKSTGLVSHFHVCGKSRKLVEIMYHHTDLDCVEPLEPPPGGDVDLAEVKQKFGDRFCLKGNLNTFQLMLRGTADDVRQAARDAIDAAAAGGGFILATGDQCGRDTPDENILAMVEVAKTYGRYA